MLKELTHAKLMEILAYDPITGEFVWKSKRDSKGRLNHRWAGRIAGTRQSEGYWQINIYGRIYLRHRLAWFYVHGAWPADQIDHCNRVRGDDRLSNLREVSRKENMLNMGMYCTNTSGISGVKRNPKTGSWIACISIDNKTKYLGSFKTAEEAHEVYRLARNNRAASLKAA